RPIQKESMDQALRNSLWNEFDRQILQELRRGLTSRCPPNAALFVRLWVYFFKWPLSSLPDHVVLAEEMVREWYFDTNGAPWNKVYDFVEFIGDLLGHFEGPARLFRLLCNSTLERESSAYRFVGKILCPITNEAEIKAIEQAASRNNDSLRP